MGEIGGAIQGINNPFIRRLLIGMYPFFLGQNLMVATLAAATILFAHAPAPIADAFIATRLGGRMRQTYGQGLERADTRAIITRASPNQV